MDVSSLKNLIQEAQTIIVAPETSRPSAASEDPKFIALLRSLQGLRDNVQLSHLSGEELGGIKNLLKIVVMAAPMTLAAARNHLRAVYTAIVKEALFKIDAGGAVRDALEDFLDPIHMVGPVA